MVGAWHLVVCFVCTLAAPWRIFVFVGGALLIMSTTKVWRLAFAFQGPVSPSGVRVPPDLTFRRPFFLVVCRLLWVLAGLVAPLFPVLVALLR